MRTSSPMNCRGKSAASEETMSTSGRPVLAAPYNSRMRRRFACTGFNEPSCQELHSNLHVLPGRAGFAERFRSFARRAVFNGLTFSHPEPPGWTGTVVAEKPQTDPSSES